MRHLRVGPEQVILCDRTRVMAIINVSADSFSGDGNADLHHVTEHAQQALAQGAAILDLGAESTRPGARPISEEEELARLLPALKQIRITFPDAAISIDTTKSNVFRAAHHLGARILNSVGGLEASLVQIVLQTNATMVITDPGDQTGSSVSGVINRLDAAGKSAQAQGLPLERIILDPGIGFGKTPEENVRLLGALPQLSRLGYVTLLGASRKSTLGLLTGKPVAEREFATSATTTLAALAHVDFVRVHDVAAARETLAVANAVGWGLRPEIWPG